MMIYIMLFAM